MPSKYFFKNVQLQNRVCHVILWTPHWKHCVGLVFVYHVLQLVNTCMLFMTFVCLSLIARNSARWILVLYDSFRKSSASNSSSLLPLSLVGKLRKPFRVFETLRLNEEPWLSEIIPMSLLLKQLKGKHEIFHFILQSCSPVLVCLLVATLSTLWTRIKGYMYISISG